MMGTESVSLTPRVGGIGHSPSSSPHYRPRYSEAESSDAAFERDERHRRCMGRKRSAAMILVFATFLFAVGIIARVYLFFVDVQGRGDRLTSSVRARQASVNMGYYGTSPSSFFGSWKKNTGMMPMNVSRIDSDGFFDVPDDEWHALKRETKTIIDLQDGIGGDTLHLLSESGANVASNLWWIDNWKINFACRDKVYFGGKWICDPSRVMTMAEEKAKQPPPSGKRKPKKRYRNIPPPRKECIIYVSGGTELEFAHQFLDYSAERTMESQHLAEGGDRGVEGSEADSSSPPCEVHVFSPHGRAMPQDAREGLVFHPWGFRPAVKESMGLALAGNATAVAFKTLDETIAELGHSGRISILAVDCEACEWDMYLDILSLQEPIRQVLLQMHGTPFMANEMFLAMQEEGYVIFHREAERGGGGEVYDYSWFKMSQTFFNWKV